MQASPRKNQRRPIRILFPRLQNRAFTLVLAMVGTSLLIHTLVSVVSLTRMAHSLPSDGKVLHGMIVGMLTRDFLLAFVITVPAFGLLAAAAFMRVVGPVHRMRTFLQGVVDGRETEPCRLRKGDEFQDICELINQATEPMRARSKDPEGTRQAA
jgi:hypothetical protein